MYAWSPLQPRSRCAGNPALLGTHLVLANFFRPLIDLFDGNVVTRQVLQVLPPVVTAGFIGAVAGNAGDVWMCSHTGTMVRLTATTQTRTQLPSSVAITGLGVLGDVPYACDSTGGVYKVAAGVASTLAVNLGGIGRGLSGIGASIYGCLPAPLGQIFNLVPATPAVSTVACPIALPCLTAPSGTQLVVAGYNYSGIASGVAGGAASSNGYVAFSMGNSIDLLRLVNGTWTSTTQLAGLNAPTRLAWANGQLIASQPSAGTVAILNLVLTALTLSQTLAIPGAGRIAVSPDGESAIVCQPSLGKATVIQGLLDVWSVYSSFVAAGITDCFISATNVAYAVGAGNLYTITRQSGSWMVTTTLVLPFNATTLAAGLGGIVVAGPGWIGMVTGNVLVASLPWPGAGNMQAFCLEGRTFVTDDASGILQGFAASPGHLALAATTAAPAGCNTIVASGSTIWLGGSAELRQHTLYANFYLTRDRNGAVAAYDTVGHTWSNMLSLGDHDEATALTVGPSGSLLVATVANSLYTLSLASGVLSSPAAPVTIAPYPGQSAGVPLGISGLSYLNGHLYATTALSGVVIGT